jgi:hypothetical protein
MLESLLQPADRKTVAAMQSERLRMQAELVEVIAAARRTVARSRALLAEVDDVLAKEKSPVAMPQISSFDAGFESGPKA